MEAGWEAICFSRGLSRFEPPDASPHGSVSPYVTVIASRFISDIAVGAL